MFSSKQNSLQLILYHDDFGTVNLLGNKVVKYKVSLFCFLFFFVLGNIPAKYRSHLNDVNLLLLSPSALVQNYVYKEILSVLDDILTLETTGTEINLGGQEHTFLGTVSMVVADNLTAHALGGSYCNFSAVARFCQKKLTSLNSVYWNQFRYPGFSIEGQLLRKTCVKWQKNSMKITKSTLLGQNSEDTWRG